MGASADLVGTFLSAIFPSVHPPTPQKQRIQTHGGLPRLLVVSSYHQDVGELGVTDVDIP